MLPWLTELSARWLNSFSSLLLLPRKSQLLTLWLAFLEISFVLKLSRGSPQWHSYHSGNPKGFVPWQGEGGKTGKILIIPQLLTCTVLLRFTQISCNRSFFFSSTLNIRKLKMRNVVSCAKFKCKSIWFHRCLPQELCFPCYSKEKQMNNAYTLTDKHTYNDLFNVYFPLVVHQFWKKEYVVTVLMVAFPQAPSTPQLPLDIQFS